jgi:hypothetical protein
MPVVAAPDTFRGSASAGLTGLADLTGLAGLIRLVNLIRPTQWPPTPLLVSLRS